MVNWRMAPGPAGSCYFEPGTGLQLGRFLDRTLIRLRQGGQRFAGLLQVRCGRFVSGAGERLDLVSLPGRRGS